MQDHRELWLIHQVPRGNTSLYLTFFSPDGLINAYFKGGRQPKMAGLLQPFLPLWAIFNKNTSLFFVQKLEQRGSPYFLTQKHLFSGLYLNELLYLCLKMGESFPLLFECYEKTLLALAAHPEGRLIEIHLRHFERQLIYFCGYECNLKATIQGEPLHPEARYIFIPQAGLEQREKGFLGQDLLDFENENFHSLAVFNTAKQVMRLAIDDLLEGRVLKSRSLFIVSP